MLFRAKRAKEHCTKLRCRQHLVPGCQQLCQHKINRNAGFITRHCFLVITAIEMRDILVHQEFKLVVKGSFRGVCGPAERVIVCCSPSTVRGGD